MESVLNGNDETSEVKALTLPELEGKLKQNWNVQAGGLKLFPGLQGNPNPCYNRNPVVSEFVDSMNDQINAKTLRTINTVAQIPGDMMDLD